MSMQQLTDLISPAFNEQLLLKIVNEKTGLKNICIDNIKLNDGDSKKGDSYLSTICRFVLEATGEDATNNKENKITIPFIVKILPKNIARRETFRSLDFFENEIIFYTKVWPALDAFQKSKNPKNPINIVPACLSTFSDGNHDFIALEDLSYKNYGSATRDSGLDYENTIAIMTVFARFHALAMAFKDQQPENFEKAATSLKETYFAEKYRSWYAKTQQLFLQVVRDAIEKELSPKYLAKVNELISNDFYGKLVEECKIRGPLSVITHGDAWIPNFLIKYGDDGKTPIDTMMIDFQLTRYTTLSNDILFFLYACIDHNLRDKYWDKIIEEYHKTFIDTLKDLGSNPELLTLDALKADIKKHAVLGVGMAMEAITMTLLDEEDVADIDDIQGDHGVDLSTVWIIRPFKTSEKRQRMAHMIKHAVDNGFI